MAQRCNNPSRHEFRCDHADKFWRWRTADGCQGSCCPACFYLPAGPNWWNDVVQLTGIDAWGIPYSREAWTEADAVGDVLRRQRLGLA